MKGTAPRGANAAEDAVIADMQADPKSQAENRMIVDLLRNDISRITEVGTLTVPKLFAVETYPTVHQMVSHVRAEAYARHLDPRHLRRPLPLRFDHRCTKCAPWKSCTTWKTARVTPIAGAIGMIAPDGTMRFNVAIRTISLYEGGEAIFKRRRRHRLRFPPRNPNMRKPC